MLWLKHPIITISSNNSTCYELEICSKNVLLTDLFYRIQPVFHNQQHRLLRCLIVCVCATLERPLCACLVISVCVSTAKDGSSVVWLAALRLPLILLKGKARQKSYDFSPSLTLAVREVIRRLQSHTREHILKNYLIYHKNAQTHARTLAHWTAATMRVRETQLMAFLYLS